MKITTVSEEVVNFASKEDETKGKRFKPFMKRKVKAIRFSWQKLKQKSRKLKLLAKNKLKNFKSREMQQKITINKRVSISSNIVTFFEPKPFIVRYLLRLDHPLNAVDSVES